MIALDWVLAIVILVEVPMVFLLAAQWPTATVAVLLTTLALAFLALLLTRIESARVGLDRPDVTRSYRRAGESLALVAVVGGSFALFAWMFMSAGAI